MVMRFEFRDLDAATRRYMVEEIEAAIRDGNLYPSRRFTPAGVSQWPDLLLDAARGHDEHWLAYQMEVRSMMKGLEGSATPSGGYTVKHVPHTAAQTMAEGQFNRYYILGLCRRAVASGADEVVVYRAKPVTDPRPESEAMVGEHLNAAHLVEELRPVQSSLGHYLLKPNSGLSVHL
jgi:hypothetical protein